MTALLEQGKTYPFSITLGTCGANFSKAAKVWIDWNANGVFEDSELVATTNVITGIGTYTGTIQVPTSVIPGNYSLMRVVLQETSNPSTITACGNYAKGETQDYRVQFQQTSTDVGVIAIVDPSASGNCSGTSAITVTLKNFGSVDVTNVPVTVTVTSPSNAVTTFKQTYTGVLTPSEEINFTFNSAYNVTAGATYTVTAATSLPGDLVTNNDRASATVTISEAPQVSNLQAYYCDTLKSYLLTGNGDGEILWYQHANDQYPIASGTPAITKVPPLDNTYYAGLNDFNATVGPTNKNAFTAGNYNQFTPSINVSTKVPALIKTARLYIGYPGQITFSVSNTNGEIVSTSTINAEATSTHPQKGLQNNDPADTGRVYTLNLLFPAAGDYQINVAFDANATIFRNNGGVSGYPFKAGDVFAITGNNASSPNDTAYYKNFYYYLYDIHLQSPGCPSAQRVPVTLAKPTISKNGNVLTSSSETGNQWFVNGSAIPGANGKTFRPFVSGSYQVGLQLDNGCVALSDPIQVDLGGSVDEIGLTAYPVPASTKLNYLFVTKNVANVTISLVSSSGQTTYSNTAQSTAGIYNNSIDVSHAAPGTYVLNVRVGSKSYSKKVIIGR